MASLAERLPVRLIPEQPLVAPVWDDVIHHCCGHDLALRLAECTQRMLRVIDEARYIDLIHRANISKVELDNIIYIPYEKVLEHDPTIINAKAAIFWLYPGGCRTLTDLFKKYEKKIKDELFLIM